MTLPPQNSPPDLPGLSRRQFLRWGLYTAAACAANPGNSVPGAAAAAGVDHR